MIRRAADRLRCFVLVVALSIVAGCATTEDKSKALVPVNRAFQAQYEAILAQQGTRSVAASKQQSFDAIRIALARIGMQPESQDPKLGYLSVFAAAPLPLSLAEWRQANEADLPLMREIVRPYIGMASEWIRFEPEGLQAVITATVLERAAGSDVSLTIRLREIAPPQSGLPRREYPPPTAVRMGLDKIWAALDQELQLRPGR